MNESPGGKSVIASYAGQVPGVIQSKYPDVVAAPNLEPVDTAV